MSSALLDRLRAWQQGRALPTTETLHIPRVAPVERLILAFVRMGGEASPWGVALGSPGVKPEVFTVPEPRNHALHAAFVGTFARRVLAHAGHPLHVPGGAKTAAPDDDAAVPFPKALLRDRQLWLPGPTHVEMLHLLDYRYTLLNADEAARNRDLRPFGRACGWLFRESTRPGQVRVHDATARLREAYAFPGEPLRQRHLGYLLAWLGEGDRAAHEKAATEAEHQGSVGVSMMPAYERDVLAPLVARYGEASTETEREAARQALHAALAPELEARFALCERAIAALDADPRPANPQLGPVIDLGLDECKFQHFTHEVNALREDLTPEQRRALGSHPETDFSPAKAASRYFKHLHAHEVASNELVHGDRVLLERALDAGDGFTGTVLDVFRELSAGAKGPGTKSTKGRVYWVVETGADETLRLREESGVCVVGARKRTGVLTEVRTEGSKRRITVAFTDGITKRAVPGLADAEDRGAWVGQTVSFLDKGVVGISLRKSTTVWDADGPGAWLTHAAPLPEPSPAGSVSPHLVQLVKGLQ